MASSKASSSAEMFNSDSKEVVSLMGKDLGVCEVSASQVAESAASSNFTTQESRPGRVKHVLAV